MRFHTFLLKYGEIGIKGKNRYLFEDAGLPFVMWMETSMYTNPRRESMWIVRESMIMRIPWNI